MWTYWLAWAAQATVPLPAYPESLALRRWHEVNTQLENGCRFDAAQAGFVCAAGVTERARGRAQAFQDALFKDPGLEYLIGLTYRYDGEEIRAVDHYRAAIALNPDYKAAWYDLGELYLSQGHYARAAEAFDRVSQLIPSGPQSWLGPWRRAEVAALQQDPVVFETQIKIALRRGFSFRQIAGLPNWRRFYADPTMRDTLDKLLTVYSEPSVRLSLQPAPE